MNWESRYLAPDPIIWQGRADVPDDSCFYQHIQLLDLLTEQPHETSRPAFAVLGFKCDEGVQRDLGRSGAFEGPIAIRHRLALEENDPTITNEIILARKYFADAVELAPYDARFLGFLGDSQLVEGQIFNNQREEVQGYFTLKRAIAMWPAFNYFTAGYPMSTLSSHSKQFKEGLAWQWKTLEVCTGRKINKKNPDYSPYMHLETQTGLKRACWNSWIAPHNFEGFFLNMGDMLVKSGDPKTAIKIYNNAKLSRTYNQWPYKNLLEDRIHNARINVQHFQQTHLHHSDKTILFNSGYGCMACHQR